MNPNEKYGRTEIAPINLLPPMECEFYYGGPAPPGLGRTETPINVLPEWVVHMPEPTPALTLTLRLRPDATAAGVAVDLFGVWRALDGYERSLRGGGLSPGEARDEQTADGTVIRYVLTAVNPVGAADRLARLAEAVNAGADPAVPREVLTGRSFAACGVEASAA